MGASGCDADWGVCFVWGAVKEKGGRSGHVMRMIYDAAYRVVRNYQRKK